MAESSKNILLDDMAGMESERTLTPNDDRVSTPMPRTDEESAGGKETIESDPNAIGWDGPDDPENPLNWAANRKWTNIGALSAMTLLTPLGSSMFAPGVPDIMREFHSTSENLATFVVSVYVLGFAFGPLLAAPMSEIFGRSIVFNISNVLFIIFTVATALSKNMGMLIVFRFLMGFSGSTPITNGSGTISDLFTIEHRGKAMAVWAMGPLLGPCIGPVVGGYMCESIGWRWVFWLIAILGGALTIMCYFLVPETFHPKLLEAKVNRLKKETGNPNLYSVLDREQLPIKKRFEHAIVRPMKMLFTHITVFLLSLYVAVAYGVLYLMFSTFTFVFAKQYGFKSGTIGLSYLPTGIGMLFGAVLFGAMADVIMKKKLATKGTTVPEDRLPNFLTIPCGVLMVVSLFWYGWSCENNTHWIVPMIGVAFFCFSLMGIMMCVQVYLIDAYTEYAASVIAASTVLRSVAGALLPLAGLSMYNDLGLGWGNSVLAFLALVLSPVPVIFLYWGAKIRAMVPDNL